MKKNLVYRYHRALDRVKSFTEALYELKQDVFLLERDIRLELIKDIIENNKSVSLPETIKEKLLFDSAFIWPIQISEDIPSFQKEVNLFVFSSKNQVQVNNNTLYFIDIIENKNKVILMCLVKAMPKWLFEQIVEEHSLDELKDETNYQYYIAHVEMKKEEFEKYDPRNKNL